MRPCVNCVKVEQLSDPVEPVKRIIDKCPAEYLAQLYGIPAFGNAGSSLFSRVDKDWAS